MQCEFCGKQCSLTDGSKQVTVNKINTPEMRAPERQMMRCKECESDGVNITLDGAKMRSEQNKEDRPYMEWLK